MAISGRAIAGALALSTAKTVVRTVARAGRPRIQHGQCRIKALQNHFGGIALLALLIYRTRFGLRLRAVGENPHAVDTAGVSVAAMRYRAMIICGLLCGIAGAYLSTAHAAGFVRDMTAGKGYLALAAMIFGKWRPVPTVLACLLFAFADALQIRLQGVALPLIGEVPVQLIQALPYALTVILLAGFVGRAVAPKASGIPYVKDR